MGEAVIQRYIADRLRAANLEAVKQEVFLDRSNIVEILPGRNRSRRIVFEAHNDGWH